MPAMRVSVLLFALFATTNLHAGVVFDIETKNNDTNPPQITNTRVLVEGRLLKLQTAAPGNQQPTQMIFRGDRREMIIIDHRTRSFIVMDQQAMQALSAQMNQAFGQMNAAMQNLTPEQRAMAGQMMNGRNPITQVGAQVTQQSPITVRQLNNRTTVYNYPSTLVEVSRDGRCISNLWITPWQNIDGAQELGTAFTDLAGFCDELMKSLPTTPGMQQQLPDNPFSALHKINGFPVAGRNYRNDGTVASETALRATQKASIGPGEFQPPAGYQQNKLFGN
jgi:hypothetical protein